MAFRHKRKLSWRARGILPRDEIELANAWRIEQNRVIASHGLCPCEAIHFHKNANQAVQRRRFHIKTAFARNFCKDKKNRVVRSIAAKTARILIIFLFSATRGSIRLLTDNSPTGQRCRASPKCLKKSLRTPPPQKSQWNTRSG